MEIFSHLSSSQKECNKSKNYLKSLATECARDIFLNLCAPLAKQVKNHNTRYPIKTQNCVECVVNTVCAAYKPFRKDYQCFLCLQLSVKYANSSPSIIKSFKYTYK